MAKRLLLDALVKVLGEYIELDESNLDLSLAVWSGQIVLHNLKLKTQKFVRKYNVSILFATVRTLEITIPWTALLNSPVKVVIDGVFLQASPLQPDELDRETARTDANIRKKSQLDKLDDILDYGVENAHKHLSKPDTGQDSEDSNTATLLQLWTAKIVDNIEITLRNVHMRYEDSQSMPGTTFAAGLTLESFVVQSCDSNWNESFVSRKPTDTVAVIHKMVRVRNLGLYWNAKCAHSFPTEYDDWLRAMQGLIYSESAVNFLSSLDATDPTSAAGAATARDSVDDRDEFREGREADLDVVRDQMSYVLAPPNTLVVKLKHFDGKRRPDEPKFEVNLQSSHLHYAIDHTQYLQLFKSYEMFDQLQQMKQPRGRRPRHRPLHSTRAVRQWWHYALFLVRKGKRYIELVKVSKSVDLDSGALIDDRSHLEQVETQLLEHCLPLHVLITLRSAAAKELKLERSTQRFQDTLRSHSKSTVNSARSATSQSHGTQGAKGSAGQSTSYLGYFLPWLSAAPAESSTSSSSSSTPNVVGLPSAGGDDVPVEAIVALLNKRSADSSSSSSTSDGTGLLYKLSFSCGASLNLYLKGRPVALASLTTSASCSMTVSNRVTIRANLSNMFVLDKFTPTPNIRYLLCLKDAVMPPESDTSYSRSGSRVFEPSANLVTSASPEGSESSESIFTVSLDVMPDRASLCISALPIQLTLNKPCVRSLLRIFSLPKTNKRKSMGPPPLIGSSSSDATAGTTLLKSKRLSLVSSRVMSATQPFWSRQGSIGPGSPADRKNATAVDTSVTQSEFVLDLVLEAHAPKIIIPEDSSSDKGYLLLDCGYLAVNGFVGAKGLSMRVALSDVNAGLPIAVKSLYSLETEKQSLYLIKV